MTATLKNWPIILVGKFQRRSYIDITFSWPSFILEICEWWNIDHGRFWLVIFVEVRARRFLGNEARFFSRYIKRDSYIFTILTALLFAHDQSTIYSILLPEPTMHHPASTQLMTGYRHFHRISFYWSKDTDVRCQWKL